MRKIINFENGLLKVNPKKAGVYQFSLRAKSLYGVESVESFLFEVLPATWSKNLILVSDVRSTEVLKYKKILSSFDLVNPDFQVLGERTLSHRESLILGTDILSKKDLITRVEKLSQKIKNVVILSPLVNHFTGPLKKELDSLGVGLAGRFTDVLTDPLSDYHFFIGRDVNLEVAKWKVRLLGALTSESSSPYLLKKKITSSCSEALSLGSEATGLDYLVTLKCKRKNGGILLVSGFEFGDFKTNIDDQNIPKKWLTRLME